MVKSVVVSVNKDDLLNNNLLLNNDEEIFE